MNQHDLNHEIARITGESDATIAALGFSLVDMSPPAFDLRRQLRRTTPRKSFKTAVNKTVNRPRKKADNGRNKPKKRRAPVFRPCFAMMHGNESVARHDATPMLKLVLPPLVLDFDRPEGA